jgi:ribonuclease kappa
MKPVVSAFNAWTWYVSVFAIIILSAIGGMFAAGNHTVMGSAEDPKDGKSVATAVFGAVVIYGVSYLVKMLSSSSAKPEHTACKL